jgi:rhodanese-related sulfurtransferase
MSATIDRERVRELINQGAQLVEVLPPAEYADEHIPGAINIPLKHLDRDRFRQLDPNRPVIVYCYDDP